MMMVAFLVIVIRHMMPAGVRGVVAVRMVMSERLAMVQRIPRGVLRVASRPVVVRMHVGMNTRLYP